MLTEESLLDLVGKITISNLLYTSPRWRVLTKGDGFLLQFVYDEPDTEDPDGPLTPQHCRKWYISPHSTATEVVRTAYKAVLTSLEHRLGEHFRFQGQQIYSPHTSLEGMLAAVSVPLDGRD